MSLGTISTQFVRCDPLWLDHQLFRQSASGRSTSSPEVLKPGGIAGVSGSKYAVDDPAMDEAWRQQGRIHDSGIEIASTRINSVDDILRLFNGCRRLSSGVARCAGLPGR